MQLCLPTTYALKRCGAVLSTGCAVDHPSLPARAATPPRECLRRPDLDALGRRRYALPFDWLHSDATLLCSGLEDG